MKNNVSRAGQWMAKCPPAISGQEGHNHTFHAATALVHGFMLSEHEAMSLMVEWNRSCQPPWSERELAHKIRQAASVPHEKQRGWLINANGSQANTPVSATGKFIIKKQHAMPDAPSLTTADFLRQCFLPDETVCICNDISVDEDGRQRPNSKGTFLTREEWITRHFTGDLSRMWVGENSKGAYIRVNPCSDQSGNDNGVSSFRHVLVEMDTMGKDEQWSILVESKLPISAVIDSGGKSLHGWVRVDASDRDEWQQRRDVVYRHLEHLGIDPKNKNASRFSRLPGVMRNGSPQKLLALKVGSHCWEDFEEHLEEADMPQRMHINDIISYDASNDPDNLIGDRWLRRGSSMLFVGQSGVGKSSMIMQQALLWSHGREWFGVAPKRPLKIGLIQAENDVADLHDALIGSSKGLFGDNWMNMAASSGIEFFRETVKTGQDFIHVVRRIIRRCGLDVLYVDPLLSYIGGDISEQETASKFLRNMLQPVMLETGVIIIVAHHFGKPKGKDSKAQSIADLAYSGLGSSELTNWAREVCILQENGFQMPRSFMLILTKRWSRSGMTDHLGNRSGCIFLKHSEGSVLWKQCPPPEAKFTVKKDEKWKRTKRHNS